MIILNIFVYILVRPFGDAMWVIAITKVYGLKFFFFYASCFCFARVTIAKSWMFAVNVCLFVNAKA